MVTSVLRPRSDDTCLFSFTYPDSCGIAEGLADLFADGLCDADASDVFHPPGVVSNTRILSLEYVKKSAVGKHPK